MSESVLEGIGCILQDVRASWHYFGDRSYVCHMMITPEDGGFTAHAIRLPGVVSEGDTVDEAVENIIDAFQATLQSYIESGMDIPWTDPTEEVDRPAGATERRILVNV
ncbi:type II toxin-antitoxin system HicB family antitoxin [Bythopirellula goksoeyrii]|uniref:HicB-like antitoxin of toxin-antitoxin system domain-containing protein n=1 Tax=Bythopirellula goksoeyrii TaxID=1400387 RepID=A0A5B9QCQ8_9BACT|nr:type II toxin-antitoxin system HicB family antitoxin [Bythopirellula goksoeyrii]QEG35395.1 hypothetical protein Pr1d_26930 [Bythopirellula goksoeyrii]